MGWSVTATALLLAAPCFAAELAYVPMGTTVQIDDAQTTCSVPLRPSENAEVCGKISAALGERGIKSAAVAVLANVAGGELGPHAVVITEEPVEKAGDMTFERLVEFAGGFRKGAGAKAKIEMPKDGSAFELVYFNGLPAMRFPMELEAAAQCSVTYLFFRKASIVSLELSGPIAQFAEVKQLAERVAKTTKMPNDVSEQFGKTNAYVLGRSVGKLMFVAVPVLGLFIGGIVFLARALARRGTPA